MTLSGNSRAGFSQCISLPAHVPFQYSGNLCSSREGLADTTQQPVSRRGTETERMKERTEQRDRVHTHSDVNVGYQSLKRMMAAIIFDKDPEQVRGGFHS